MVCQAGMSFVMNKHKGDSVLPKITAITNTLSSVLQGLRELELNVRKLGDVLEKGLGRSSIQKRQS